MTEATWGDADKTEIDWRVSAALRNVPRGGDDLAEVTSLEQAVRAWADLDAQHKDVATLTVERPILITGATMTSFTGGDISILAERLPTRPATSSD